MVTRVIRNDGTQLILSDAGVPVSDVCANARLVDPETGQPTDAFDTITGEHVISSTATFPIINGLISAQLWPTDRADHAVQYRVWFTGLAIRTFYVPLPSGTEILSWCAFLTGSPAGGTIALDSIVDVDGGSFDGSTPTGGIDGGTFV